MRTLRIGSALLLAAFPLAARAELSIVAEVDRQEVEVGGELVLTITQASDSQQTGDIEFPATPDFDVLSRSQSSSMSFAFGSGGATAQKQITWTLVLTPRKEGMLTIGPARLTFQGKSWQTRPISVRAVAPGKGSAPPPQAMPAPRVPPGFPGFAEPVTDSRSIFVRATLDRPRAWLGEQVTMVVTLYSRLDISRIEGMTMPRLDGFWAEDIESPTQITGELRQIEGVPYRAYVLKRRALFPMRAGKLVVDPVEVEVATGFGLFFSGRSVRRSSPRVELEVASLPAAGRPAVFDSVNVGEWSLTSSIEPLVTGPSQPVTYRLVAEGKGNLRSLSVPRLAAIPGFKIYEPTQEDKIKIDRGRYGGRRTIDYLLIPERTGSLTIPPLEMAYFDPAAGGYKVAQAAGATIEVSAGAAAAKSGEPVAPGGGANVLAAGLKPIRHRTALGVGGLPLYRRPWFAALVALPFALLILGAVADRLREASQRAAPQARVRRARSRAQKRLRGAQKLLGQGKGDAFCAEVDRALVEYVGDRAGVAARGLTREELKKRLEESGHAPAAVGALCEALEACDALRYSPAAGEEEARREIWVKAGEALAQMEEGRR